MKRKLYIIPLLAVLFTLSCDEFLLKKTVSLKSVKGEIFFEPKTTSLKGQIECVIKNRKEKPLSEIYFVCHPAVSIDLVIYKNSAMRFEQGINYGYGIYRIKIPHLYPNESTKIILKFKVKGPIKTDRFILTKDMIFFDAKKIWVPVPFADLPLFSYEFIFHTPKEYYAVIGGKLIEEKIVKNTRISIWISETKRIKMSANLFISKFKRFQKDNIYIYSKTTNNIDDIANYTKLGISKLTKLVGYFPFSQTHVINKIFQYKDMNECIDGEFFANTIQVASYLFSATNLQPESNVINSAIPFLPKNNKLQLFNILVHELCHAYTPHTLNFDDNSHINMESFTEHTKNKVIEITHPNIYPRLLEKNRIILINYSLKKRRPSRLSRYFYGVNSLGIAFLNKNHINFDFLNILIKKYRFTKINRNQLIVTADEMNKIVLRKFSVMSNTNIMDINKELINVDALKLWKNNKLYNIALSSTNVWVSNKTSSIQTKWKTIVHKKQITIQNNFPVAINGILIHSTKRKIKTNYVQVKKQSSTNIIVNKWTQYIDFQTDFSYLETDLKDNSIFLNPKSVQQKINYANFCLNQFYTSGTINKKAIMIDKTYTNNTISTNDNQWQSIYKDRETSISMSPKVNIVFDKVYSNKNEIYVEAYKYINNKRYSYVVIKMQKVGRKYRFIAILDPSFE